jgi:hypothetical protein
VATNQSAGVAEPTSMIITILSDDSRAHAYRTVQEMLSTENQLPTWSCVQGIRFYNNRGFQLEPRFGPTWQLTDLVPVGESNCGVVLSRLHTVLDRAIDRVRRNPESVEDWGVTCADAIADIEALRRLGLEDLVDQESALLDAPMGESTLRGGQDGPVPHGSWWHRIWYH